jgi:hypothetical protein
MLFLSPVEKAVLASCEQDRTIAEVQADLRVEFDPEQVTHGFRFLRRARLLELDEDANSLDPNRLFRQSAVGALLLLRQRLREVDGVLAHA